MTAKKKAAPKKNEAPEEPCKPFKLVWRFSGQLPDIGHVLQGERVTKEDLKALEANALTEETYTVKMS